MLGIQSKPSSRLWVLSHAELIATYSSFNLTKRPPSTPLRSAKSRKSLGTPKRSRRAQTATGSRRRRPSQGSHGSRPSTTAGHRTSRAMLPLSPGARRRLAKPPTLETPLGEDAYSTCCVRRIDVGMVVTECAAACGCVCVCVCVCVCTVNQSAVRSWRTSSLPWHSC